MCETCERILGIIIQADQEGEDMVTLTFKALGAMSDEQREHYKEYVTELSKDHERFMQFHYKLEKKRAE